MGLKDIQRAGGVARFIFISLGVICLHAVALWLISVDTHQAPPATPPFVVLVAPAELPRPVTTPTATKSAEPTARAGRVPRTQKLTKDLSAPALKHTAAPPAPDTQTSAATENGSTHATEPAPANLPLQTRDRNATSAGTGSDKTAPSIQLPSSNADYLNNPAPVYPALSQRLGEQGKVVIRVLIGKDGTALRGDIHQSSGFERLDQAALRAVMSWRYVPGQRAGMAQDMWFNVPVNFSLN